MPQAHQKTAGVPRRLFLLRAPNRIVHFLLSNGFVNDETT